MRVLPKEIGMEKLGVLDSLRISVLAEDSVLYESPYLGQHGVSFLLEGVSGENTKRILVDVGQNSEALLYNMRTMGISPSIIDAIVLTHCHYDHTQGVANLLWEIGKKDVQVIAHPSIFRLHFVTEPYPRHVGIMQGDSQVEMEKAGASLSLTREPFIIMPGIITTGEVRRKTEFEGGSMGLKTIENGMVIADLIFDDISVVANVRDKGLVIITGCSHAGIINIANHAIEITGCDKIEGIIGGLHLVEATDTVIKRTIEELSKLNVSWISAGHCTGFKAQVELYLAFGDRFSPLHTGTKFELV
jgi:7,8-dihydropterin-6-yl-methyl-4-(beta-D-ribofuranosyl)aminobenzene 5'-phosphate synthase